MKHAPLFAVLSVCAGLMAAAAPAPAPKAEPAVTKKEDAAIQQIDQQIANAKVDKSKLELEDERSPSPKRWTFDAKHRRTTR